MFTPIGRRGKGKTVLGVTYAPPPPTDATQVILQTSDLPKSSHLLRTQGKSKYIVVPGQTVKREEGWEVDFKGFLNEQATMAPRGTLPEATRVFLDVTGDPTLWDDKVPDLASAGLTGVLVDNPAELAKAADLGLAAMYRLNDHNHADGIDVSKHLSDLPSTSTSAIALVVLPGYDEDFYQDAEESASSPPPPILKKPKAEHSEIPCCIELGVPAGEGLLQSASRKLGSMGYDSILMLPSVVPPTVPPTASGLASFWCSALAALSSPRSQAFGGFRSKVSLEKDVPMEWMKYQKDIMASGALGKVGAKENDDVDTLRGDYQGF